MKGIYYLLFSTACLFLVVLDLHESFCFCADIVSYLLEIIPTWKALMINQKNYHCKCLWTLQTIILSFTPVIFLCFFSDMHLVVSVSFGIQSEYKLFQYFKISPTFSHLNFFVFLFFQIWSWYGSISWLSSTGELLAHFMFRHLMYRFTAEATAATIRASSDQESCHFELGSKFSLF